MVMYYLIVARASFELPHEKNILVLGDSSTTFGIDDSIYSRSTNISGSGTTYVYSYFKLGKFLDENDHIDTVLLSLQNAAIVDLEMFEKANMMYHVPFLLPFFDRDAIAIFVDENRKPFISSVLNISPRPVIRFILKRGAISYQNLSLGGYEKLDRNKLQEDISLHNTQPSEEKPYSPIQKKYLLKIVSLCKSNNITLILINTPTYKPDLYGHLDTVNDFYNTYLSGVTDINYSAFPLPDSCYADIGHLNYNGAEIFSKYLQ
jgi:hypothetical protein